MILGLISFSIFINSQDEGKDGALRNRMWVTPDWGNGHCIGSRGAIQRDLDNLRKWTDENLMKVSIILHLRQRNPRKQHSLGKNSLRSSSVEKDWGPW